jgi:hypothetical protein
MSTPAWVEELTEAFSEYSESLSIEDACAKQLLKASARREAAWNRIQALARKVAEAQK